MPKAVKFQPFIREEVLVGIYHVCVLSFFPSFSIYFSWWFNVNFSQINVPQDVFPSTVEQIFALLLNDGSNFINEYRAVRKDTNLSVSTKILW